jgi:hypothetical protein
VVATGNQVYAENSKVNKQDMQCQVFYAKTVKCKAGGFAEFWKVTKYADVLFFTVWNENGW